MDERIEFRVMGISYSQTHSGVSALLLAQVDGPVKIPIVIGNSEAQSIAIKIEGITPPRPLTHDLFVSFAHAFGVILKEVFIYKFEDGIFHSEMLFDDGERQVSLDARTSDAIAIAMRTHAPIYTTRAIMDEAGFEMETQVDPSAEDETPESLGSTQPRLENYTIEELERTLARLIENEEYEQAEKVQAILDMKRKNNK